MRDFTNSVYVWNDTEGNSYLFLAKQSQSDSPNLVLMSVWRWVESELQWDVTSLVLGTSQQKQSCVQDWFVFTEAGPPHRQAIFMLSVHYWYYRMCCLWWGFVGLQTLETWLCDTFSCLFVGLLHPENIHECNFCPRNSCMYDVPCFTCYIWGYVALSSGFGVCCAMSTWRLEA